MAKVINRNDVLRILKDGGYTKWDDFGGRGMIFDKDENFIGTMQYRTYTIIIKHTERKPVVNSYGRKEDRDYFKKQLTNLEELKKFIPEVEKLTNDNLHLIINRIQKEISKRNKEDLKNDR